MNRFTGKHSFLWAVVLVSACVFCTPHQVLAANELKVGFVTPLTGGQASWGQQYQSMANLILGEIKAAGGFKLKNGKKIKVVFKYYDAESSPEVASSVTTRAIADGCKVIVPGPGSNMAFSSSEISERAGILSLDPSDTATTLTQRGFKYYFRMDATSHIAVIDTIRYLLAQEKKTGHKVKRVALFGVDNTTGVEKAKALATEIPKLAPHWKIVDSIRYPASTNDFTIYLNKFKAQHVDILLGDQFPNQATLITRQCRAINYNPIAIEGIQGGWMDPDYAKNLQWQAIGTTVTVNCSPFAKLPGLELLVAKYKKRYGVDPPPNALNVGTVISLIKAMVEKAGSINEKAMREALVKIDVTRLGYQEGQWWWPWTFGCKFAKTGQNIKASDLTVMWTSPTSLVPVYPWKFAVAQAPWPRLTWKELEKKYAEKYPVGK